MKTPYHGDATIGDDAAEVDIENVDLVRWKGTASAVAGVAPADGEAIVTLLDQPRPGWSARARATGGADGSWELEGIGQFFAPKRRPVGPETGSRWVRKRPRPT